jgi:hypothetical protein
MDKVMSAPKFTELMLVRVNFPAAEAADGYVLRSEWQDGRWVYELSFPDTDRPGETYENWAPEEWLSEAG